MLKCENYGSPYRRKSNRNIKWNFALSHVSKFENSFFNEIPVVVRKEKENGNKIVQCHGTFDLIHPGHIIHFEESKAMGDKLIVTVTSEKFVNKDPDDHISMTDCDSSPSPLLNQ